MKKKRIIVFGGDGFCGWPTSLYLSNKGHEVSIVDNLSRRDIDKELGVVSLTPIKDIYERLQTWKEKTGKEIEFQFIDIASQYNRLLEFINYYKPDVVIHFAEQRSAPFSMKDSKHKRYTVNNNINATHNLLSAVVESEQNIHVVHLGTTGVYGYSTTKTPIPEGYLKVFDENKNPMDILYPADPGSIYHMTKCMDQLMFYYYNKNDNLKITDLHQGIIYGTQTKETILDERLINRFDYDGDFGTVLNRFLMQAALDYPLTVHGTGGQTRAFINMNDTVKCIELAIKNPPRKGEKVKILNQFTETHNVNDLAKLIQSLTDCKTQYVKNPRNEAEENKLFIKNDNFLKMGLKPILLKDELLTEIYEIAQKYKHRCDKSKIMCTSYWTKKNG